MYHKPEVERTIKKEVAKTEKENTTMGWSRCNLRILDILKSKEERNTKGKDMTPSL